MQEKVPAVGDEVSRDKASYNKYILSVSFGVTHIFFLFLSFYLVLFSQLCNIATVPYNMRSLILLTFCCY